MADDTYGWIKLSGLRAGGARVGVYPHEHHSARTVLVDVAIYCETATAANTESLADSIDYDQLALAALDVCRARPYKLLETLCERLAAALLERFGVLRVRVEVHKPEASHGATASVAIERSR